MRPKDITTETDSQLHHNPLIVMRDTTVSFKCPEKRTTQHQQNFPTPLTQTNTTYAKVATSTVPPLTQSPTPH